MPRPHEALPLAISQARCHLISMNRTVQKLTLPLQNVLLSGLVAVSALAFAPTAMADERTRPRDPAIEVPHPRPPLLGRPPSPGNSEASSPVRDYLYRPPADSGSITDRLVPPSTVRPGPRGY